MLRSILRWILKPLSEHQKGDFRIAFFCACLAVLFWVFNALNRNYNTDIKFPVKIKFDKNKIVQLQKSEPQFVHLNVSSFGWTLVRRGFLSSLSPLKLDITTIPEGNYVLAADLVSRLQTQLKGVTINEVKKDTIPLHLSYIINKKIKIRVDSAAISLLGGYKINGKVNIQPQELEVTGPKESLDKITDTLTINLSSKFIESAHKEEFPVNFKDKLVSVENKYIKVSFDVVKAEEVK